MKGDFSRFTFDPARHFTRVLMQQGRVQLDSDFNEQVDILWHYLRTLATDLIGPYGGPNSDQLGFKITGKLGSSTPPALEDLIIGFGRYYVDGILCENTPSGAMPGDYRRAGLVRMADDSASGGDMNEMDEMGEMGEARTLKAGQPGMPAQQQGGLSFYGQSGERLSIEEARSRYGELKPPFFVFLDVWERSVSAVEAPEILEAALGGQDTAARSQVVWQVRAASMEGMASPEKLDCKDLDEQVFLDFWNKVTNKVPPEKRGRLSAKAREPQADESTDPCIISPDARYRGAENQLYRVEIHTGGVINASPPPTFKWSRDNGSNIYPVITIKDKTVFLEHLGRDGRSGLQAGDWVEIVDDDYTLRGKAQPLSQVDSVDAIGMSITLKKAPHAVNTGKQPLLRRWDQRASGQKNSGLKINDNDNAVLLKAGGLNLEDGIQVYFEEGRTYVAGDYWLIPARTATGDIQWPRGEDAMLPPQGVEHYYAPLAGVFLLPSGPARKGGLYVTDYRFRFDPLAECSDRVIGSPQ